MQEVERKQYEELKSKSINGTMSIQQALKYFELKHKVKETKNNEHISSRQ